jgi:hypothetical protein
VLYRFAEWQFVFFVRAGILQKARTGRKKHTGPEGELTWKKKISAQK